MPGTKGHSGGKRKNQRGRPVGTLNRDTTRPYFATLKNSILKKNPTWIEEIEYYMAVMNDPNELRSERNSAAHLLLTYTYTRPTPAEMQPQEQLSMNLSWGDNAAFDPAALPATQVASKGASLN